MVRSDHAIFRGPLPVTPTLTDDIDPVTKRQVRVWKTHEPVPYTGKLRWFFRQGTVVSGTRLLGAEDSEIISGGMNTKGDHGAALAREAHFFHWGPAATPRHMTEEGRRVFINTIVYMKQFDGAKQTVWRGVRPRSELALYFKTLTLYSGQLASYLKKTPDKQSPREGIEEIIETLRNDIKGNIERIFPLDVAQRLGYDVEKYRALYEPNIGYIYVPHETTAYAIDEEAQSI